jgi:two-component system sensor histidine kinase KdpD
VDALARQRDLERLYALSRALLLSDRGAAMPDIVARQIAEIFRFAGVALYDHRTGVVSHAGPSDVPDIDDALRAAVRRGIDGREPSGAVVTAIRLGGAPIGALGILAPAVSDTVLQSMANLAGIALERARGQEAASRAEAARESSELRAAVLDAVAHEFKTPLTSIKAASSELAAAVSPDNRDLVHIVQEEADRLQALVTDAIQMLRVEAGGFAVHRESQPLAKLVAAVLRESSSRLDAHAVHVTVPPDLVVDADGDLLRLALRQLLDNAAKYSAAGSRIEIQASTNDSVDIVVRNEGPVIPASELSHVFDRFYRGLQARLVPGTGMGLAIVRQIAQAHGGSVRAESAPESGTAFTLSLPRGGTGV